MVKIVNIHLIINLYSYQFKDLTLVNIGCMHKRGSHPRVMVIHELWSSTSYGHPRVILIHKGQ
jgi:hypothetical protein